MPYKIRKIKSRKYKVVNSKTGKIYSKNTTLKRAKAQVRFLGMIESRKMKGGYIIPHKLDNFSKDIPEGVIDVNSINNIMNNNMNNNNNVNLYAPFADEQHILDFIDNDEFEDYFNTIEELESDIDKLENTISLREERGLNNHDMNSALDKLNEFLNRAQQGGKKRMK